MQSAKSRCNLLFRSQHGFINCDRFDTLWQPSTLLKAFKDWGADLILYELERYFALGVGIELLVELHSQGAVADRNLLNAVVFAVVQQQPPQLRQSGYDARVSAGKDSPPLVSLRDSTRSADARPRHVGTGSSRTVHHCRCVRWLRYGPSGRSRMPRQARMLRLRSRRPITTGGSVLNVKAAAMNSSPVRACSRLSPRSAPLSASVTPSRVRSASTSHSRCSWGGSAVGGGVASLPRISSSGSRLSVWRPATHSRRSAVSAHSAVVPSQCRLLPP